MEKRLKTVLLVDDEQLMLNSMKSLVDWKAHGFSIAATACNGKRALEYYKQLCPDLVITDIVMPIMDGLELIKEIRKISEETYILIITAYDEFEYAKKALQSGVADYILKTEIARETFYEKLAFIFQKLEARSISKQYVSNMELQSFFNALPLQEKEQDASVPDKLLSKRFSFFVLSKRQPLRRKNTRLEMTAAEQDEKRALYCQQVRQAEVLPVFLVFVNHYVILAVSAWESAPLQKQRVRSVASFLAQRLRGEISFVFYHPVPMKIVEFRRVFYDHYSRLEFYSHFGKNAFLNLLELEAAKAAPIYRSFSYPTLGSEKEAARKWEKALGTHLEYLFSNSNFAEIDRFFKGFCYYWENALENDMLFEEEILIQGQEEFLSWFISEWRRCMLLYEDSKRISCSPVVAETLELIQSRYGEIDMSIELLSRSVGMSPGRLAQRFRQEIGKTINEYLTDTRVNAAVFLLKNTNERVYDIAEKVGYGSAQYFSQVFYKKTGQKPLDLRRGKEKHEK